MWLHTLCKRHKNQLYVLVSNSNSLFSSSNEKIGEVTCSAVGCPGTDLEDPNTYFAEYVLEKSNASNFFNVYVAGFTFAPAENQSSNSSGVNLQGSDMRGKGPTSTVWYSNQVKVASIGGFISCGSN